MAANHDVGFSWPEMGLGTWAWGSKETWGMGGYDPSFNLDTIREAYRTSVEAGVTLLDTAEMYGEGESERIIGKLLEEDAGHRDRVVVATKFLPYPWRIPMKRALLDALRASLDRLRLPFVHLYQIHGPISMRPASVLADGLARAVGDGLVKAVGVSNYSEREMRAMHRALARSGIPLASNQVEYSLLRTFSESTGLLAACRELGVTVLAYSPLGQGRLTGKYSAANPPPGKRDFSNFPMHEVEPIVAELRRIGEERQRTPAQVALNWTIRKGTIPIPGAKTEKQAEQNAGAIGWQLNAEELRRLDAVSKLGQRSLFHRIWQHG